MSPQLAQAPLFSVQLLRALAAIAIVLHHGLHEAHLLATSRGGTFPYQFRWPLEAGVDLFFVISGFVMVVASRDLFGLGRAVLPFLRRRLARIVPIYWAATILFLAVAMVTPQAVRGGLPQASEIIASLFFVPFQRPDGTVQPVYSLGWTLNYEMLFYVIFACFLPLQRGVAVAGVLLLLASLVLFGQQSAQMSVPLQFWTQPIILTFGYGVLLGYLYLAGFRPRSGQGLALAMVALVGLLLAHAFFGGSAHRVVSYGLPSALLVFAATSFANPQERSGLLSIGAQLGDASYALYLLHPFVLKAMSLGWKLVWPSVPPLIFLIGAVAGSCLVATAVWRSFERPLTRWLQGQRQLKPISAG